MIWIRDRSCIFYMFFIRTKDTLVYILRYTYRAITHVTRMGSISPPPGGKFTYIYLISLHSPFSQLI